MEETIKKIAIEFVQKWNGQVVLSDFMPLLENSLRAAFIAGQREQLDRDEKSFNRILDNVGKPVELAPDA